MTVVARLLTFVDLRDGDDDGPGAQSMSVSATLVAVLADARRITLLDDRGWSERLGVVRDEEPSQREGEGHEPPGIWAHESVEDVKQTARDVVGPDEPFEGRTWADMETSHWNHLARILEQKGVEVGATRLSELPHDVELSQRVLTRIGGRSVASGEL